MEQDDIDSVMQQEADAQKQKTRAAAFGALSDTLSSGNSFGNYFLGHLDQPTTHGADLAKATAGNISDPIANQQKAAAYLKSKNDAADLQGQGQFRDSLADDDQQPAKAYKQMLISSGMDPATVNGSKASDLYAQGFSPAKMAEIKAKSNVDFNDKAKLFQMEQAERSKDKKDLKKNDNDNKDAQALENTLSKGWAARGGQAGSVQGKILAAERAEQLLEQGKLQPGGLDSRQLEELAESTSNLLGGGAQASARVSALLPHTFWGNLQSAKEWASNSPTGTDQTKFTDRMAETVAREKALAIKQMQQFQNQSLPAHERLKKSNPELYNGILTAHGLNGGGGQFDDDVLKYAKDHSISPQEAQNVKNARTSNVGQK